MCPPPIHRAETQAAFSHESGGSHEKGGEYRGSLGKHPSSVVGDRGVCRGRCANSASPSVARDPGP